MSNKYYKELTSLIKTYKNKLSLYNDDLNNIDDYLENISIIINYLDYDEHKIDLFFAKSYLGLLLPFDNYIPFKNGDLQSNSGNCTFTLATVATKEKKDEILFIKVVDKEEQNQLLNTSQDLLLFDIIVSFTFDYIFKNDISFKHYSKFIPNFKYSFPTYTRALDYYSKNWNYNDLINYNSIKTISPYSVEAIETPSKTEYEIESYIVMYEAINSPTTISKLVFDYFTSKTAVNKNNLLGYFSKVCDLYDFIKDIGLKYGFMHNDLHLSNVIYDKTSDKLLMIDFGRASFAKFIKETNEEINKLAYSEFVKLYYYAIIGNIEPHDTQILKKLYDNYSYNGTRHSIIGSNDNYFGIIYDLITFTMNLYLYLIAYIYTEDKEAFQTFSKHFYKIIAVRFDSMQEIISHTVEIKVVQSVDQLIEHYCDIRDNYINTPQVDCDTKRFYLTLLEGLLYSALFYQYNKLSNIGWFSIDNTMPFIFSYFQILTNMNALINFKNFIVNDILGNSEYAAKLSSDSFLKHFIDKSKMNGGGYDAIAKMKTKSISKSKPFSLFADYIEQKNKKVSIRETAKAYENIFNESYDSYKPTIKSTKRSPSKRLLKQY